MNRKSLFGRLAKTTMVSSAAERQEHFRAHLEPLEDRKLLALTVWYNDNWVVDDDADLSGTLTLDDKVSTTTDFGAGVSNKNYGTEAFGRGTVGTVYGGSLPYLHDAIIGVDATGTILVGSGTFQESDIVVSKAVTISAEAGNLFVPEVTSSGDTSDFGAGTHSGFIIRAGSVTISGVHLDGNGGALSGSLNYHHGITTLYTNPGGGYVSIRDMTISAIQIGDAGEHGAAETIPNLRINNVTVENVFWHGITLSARENETFHRGPDPALTHRNLTIRDSIVTNVGPGTKTEDHIGILVQNLVSSTASDLANLNANTITNVGIGVKAAPYGTQSLWFQDGDGLIEFNDREDYPNNNASAVLQTVYQASIRAYDFRYGTSAGYVGNKALSGSAGATGFYILHAEGFGSGMVSEGYGIGMHVQDDHIGVIDSLSPWRKWRFTGTWETDDIVRMTISGQSLQISAGSTVIPDIIDAFVAALNGSVQSNFTPITWSRVGDDLYGKADSPSANATGTVALFESDGTTAGDLQRLATQDLVSGGQATSHGGFTIGADQPLHNLLAGSSFTGPGIGTVGSVGLLINNDSTHNNSSDFFLSTGVVITGFETGVKVEQTVTPGNQRNNTLAFDRPDITGNGTDLVIGERSILVGESRDTIGSVKTQGSGRINLGFTEDDERNPYFYDNSVQPNPPNTTPPIVAHDRAGTLGATNITLGSGTSFTPLITGQTASGVLWDFDDMLTYGSTPLPPANYQDGKHTGPGVAALTSWGGLVTQDGSGEGAVVVADAGELTATNGAGTSAFYGYDVTSTSWAGGLNPTFYYFTTLDITGADHINLKMKLEASTDAKVILFGMIDDRGNWFVQGLPIQGHLNAVNYTTLSISVLSPEIDLVQHDDANGEDGGFNLSRVAAYVFGGDAGFINGNTEIPLEFRVDEVTMSSQKASALTVTGSIDLGGATLTPEVLSGFNPLIGEQITIINKISGGGVTGTFAGLAEGAMVTASTGHKFTISYAGGDGNEVVLTAVEGISISDVSQVETNAGTTNFVFSVTLTQPSDLTTTVRYDTADGSATTGDSDYVAQSGTLTFDPGQVSKTITVLVNGDTTVEADQTFLVNLSSPTNATLVDGSGTGTILNDDVFVPNISINDVSQVETNAGTTNFVFSVTLSGPNISATTVAYTTANGTATTGNADYVAQSGTLTFAPSEVSKTITVLVNGDIQTIPTEANETFFVNLSGAVNGVLLDASGLGTILNDDGAISIGNAILPEGNSGTTNFVFSVTLANASALSTTVRYDTADGTATTAGSDYTGTTGTLTFAPGEVSKTVTVLVTGDTTVEGHQNFLVNLSLQTNSTLTDGSGAGWIIDDDTVTGRRIFYNQSGFDGNNAAMVRANDNSAIAPDKSAYFPGTEITVFNNVTSYSRGINGIIVDLLASNGGTHASITAADFIFKTGSNNTPSSWATIAPTSVAVFTAGGATTASDRVEIIWATGTIRNKWLEVQVKANTNTGLSTPDVFFWGNRIGDSGTGQPATTFATTSIDTAQTNANQSADTSITNLRNFNRLAGVTSLDTAIANSNQGTIVRINIPAAGPFAPSGADDGGGDGGGSAIASALAATSSSSGGSASGWIAASLAAADGGSGGGGSTETAKADSARATAVGDVADELADDSLDELLADLAAG